MAWKDIPDEAPTFGKKFSQIGETYVARIIRTQQSVARYEDGPKVVTEYVFRGNVMNADTGKKELTEYTITPPKNLLDKLQRAEAKGDLPTGALCEMKYTSDLPVKNQAQPMKVISLRVDTDGLPKIEPLEHRRLSAAQENEVAVGNMSSAQTNAIRTGGNVRPGKPPEPPPLTDDDIPF